MARKMIIKGVGSFMAKQYKADGTGIEVVTLGSLQDLKITMNVELEDIFGGDGLFAIDTLVKSKSIEISATDAKFDLAAIQLMMGSTVKESTSSYVWILNEDDLAVADNLPGTDGLIGGADDVAVASIEPKYAATLYSVPDFQVKIKDTNTLLTLVAYSDNTAPTDKEFSYDATNKKLILNVAHTGKDILINYKRTETVDLVDLLVDEVPFNVHVIHHGSFLQKDGTFAGVETELFSCRAKGSFTMNHARATASASEITLIVLDPERADGKLGTIKRYSAKARI